MTQTWGARLHNVRQYDASFRGYMIVTRAAEGRTDSTQH